MAASRVAEERFALVAALRRLGCWS